MKRKNLPFFGVLLYSLSKLETRQQHTPENAARNTIKAFLNDESGATAIEYGLIAALVSVAGITAFQSLGTSLGTMFSTVASTITDAGS